MGKRAMQFGGKHKLRIHRCHFSRPQFGQFGLDVSVERGVDLYHIETARYDLERMLLSTLHAGRVKDSIPVFIGPAGGANADARRDCHVQYARRLAQADAWQFRLAATGWEGAKRPERPVVKWREQCLWLRGWPSAIPDQGQGVHRAFRERR